MAGRFSIVVVTGKSGAGKQPRIDVLCEAFGLQQLSTGSIFRRYLAVFRQVEAGVDAESCWRGPGFASDAEILAALAPSCRAAGVDPASALLGLKTARYLDSGHFVPDGITDALLEGAFRAAGSGGLVLDGYPRSPDQSRFLLDLVERTGARLDLLLVVENEDELILARTVGRRICSDRGCSKVFHLRHKPPREGGFCTACGAPVEQRSDDTEERIRTRLAEFQAKALPAIRVLEQAKIPTVSVSGNLPVFTDEAVRESVTSALAPLLA